ncbi:MAG: CHAD domain-containing protein [Prochlorococcaceae cyanobacterium]
MAHLHAEVLADQDPEPLHRMRVCFRRLRSTAEQFEAVLILPPAVSPVAMAKIGRRLGMPRDLDVLRQRLEHGFLPRIAKQEQQRLKPVMKQLRRERRLAFDDLRETLHSSRYLRLLSHLRLWLRSPHCNALAYEPVQLWLPEWSAGVLTGVLVHPGWRVGSLVEPDAATELHDLRKVIKRCRYGLTNLQGVPGSEVAPWIARFKTLQEHLGDLNDFDVLEKAIVNLLDGDPAERLPELCALIAADRSQAWLRWHSEAAFFRSLEGRRSLYRMMLAGQPF